jgi:parallel beta-helix repeat protein
MERGVIIAASSGTRIDLSGVVIESGDSVPSRFVGIGIASKGVDGVAILGGSVRGYRFGARLEGGKGHRISGIDVSGSRSQQLGSTTETTDSTDRLDWRRLEAFTAYGGGVLLQGTVGASIIGITARGAQNGIGLVDARESYVAENRLEGNSGWAIQLWRSSQNTILRNQAGHTRRCPATATECAAAAILIREASDSNTLGENDLSASSTGLLLTAATPDGKPSVGNLIYRNDASHAESSGFIVVRSWNTTLLENRADSVENGFKLDRLKASLVRGNTVIGAREAGVLAEYGNDNSIEANVLLDARVGVFIVSGGTGVGNSRGYRIDDNVVGGTEQGIVLRGISGSKVRGNVLDQVGDGLVIDGPGYSTEVTGNVFLRASGWFIEAPDLTAGGNYWATANAADAAAKVRGRISVLPWKPASAAGY